MISFWSSHWLFRLLTEAISCLEQAVNLFSSIGRFSSAARYCKVKSDLFCKSYGSWVSITKHTDIIENSVCCCHSGSRWTIWAAARCSGGYQIFWAGCWVFWRWNSSNICKSLQAKSCSIFCAFETVCSILSCCKLAMDIIMNTFLAMLDEHRKLRVCSSP